MDYQTVVIGYGNGLKFRQSHQQGRNASGPLPPKQNTGPKVDVFIGDELIRSIPLKLLTRFSDAGRRVFPRPEQQAAAKPSFSMRASTTSSPKVDSALDWADDADEAEEASIVAGPSTKKPHSARQNAHPSNQDLVAAPTSLAFAKPRMQKRTLQLKLDVIEMPSKGTLLDALKWMEDNEASDKALIDYAPPRLEMIKLDYLVDIYQAALAFELRPWGKAVRIRKEICNRVSQGRTFERLSEWLPADDVVIVRCINSMEYHRRKGGYSEAEIHQVTAFLQQPGNEKLDAKFVDILQQWHTRRETIRCQQTKERGQREGAHIGDIVDGAKVPASNQSEKAKNAKNATTASTTGEQSTDNQTERYQATPRRRNRRAQKAKGMAGQGQDVPDASPSEQSASCDIP